ETQLEQTKRPAAANGQRTGFEAAQDPPSDADIDDHADPQPYPDVTHTERPRRQENERRVVPGKCARWRNGADVEDTLRTWSYPDPLRTHPEPLRATATRPHLRLSVQRTGEARSRDVDEHGAASGVPDDDRGGRRSLELQAERAGAEPDAAPGRGTLDGCRGRHEDHCRENAS